MNTCKNCKYWEFRNFGYDGQWHECMCPNDNLADNGIELYAECLDNSGLEYGMKTGPNFACNQFKASNNE